MMLSAVMLIVSLKTYEISPTVTTVTAACNINIDATVIMANSDTAQVPTFYIHQPGLTLLQQHTGDQNSKNGYFRRLTIISTQTKSKLNNAPALVD